MNRYKELIGFAKPRYALHILGILLLFVGILMSIMTFLSQEWSYFACGILITLFMGVGCIAAGVSAHIKFRKKIKLIDEQGMGDILLNDFNNAGRAFSGALVVGDEFLIGKRTGNVLHYSEIVRIYQFIPEQQLIAEKRYIKAETASARNLLLSDIPSDGRGAQELNGVIQYVTAKNPSIQVGFIG